MPAKKVLVVDDSRTSLFMETMILRKHHYEVVTACDGVEAIEQALRERPDLVLMDVVMPRLTGIEACRELRQRPDTRALPIILCTTRGESENVDSGFDAGCDDYVTKPIRPLELLLKVNACLERASRSHGTSRPTDAPAAVGVFERAVAVTA